MALPLLPEQHVQTAFDQLNEKIPVDLEQLFEYFDDWWMKQVPIRLWNVSNLKARTNNNVECMDYSIFSCFMTFLSLFSLA
jgi:hypothetical protein